MRTRLLMSPPEQLTRSASQQGVCEQENVFEELKLVAPPKSLWLALPMLSLLGSWFRRRFLYPPPDTLHTE
ncbi:hypothetical protein ANTQUA_LOCUS3814 [Anthophora quadrimaculata]